MESSYDLGFGCEGNGGRGILGLPVPGQETQQLILKFWNRGLLSVLLYTVLGGEFLSPQISHLPLQLRCRQGGLELGNGLDIAQSEVRAGLGNKEE